MAWIERLIDCVPDMTAIAGGLLALSGGVGILAGLALACTPLVIGAMLLALAGAAGPALSELKQERKPPTAKLSPLQEAEQDAAVDAGIAALEREMETENRWRVFVSIVERPPCGRLH